MEHMRLNRSKNTSFADRLSAPADAKRAELERARARSAAESPAAVERRTAREAVRVARDARIAERIATKLAMEARQAAALAAAQTAEAAAREAALKAEQEARDAEFAERTAREAWRIGRCVRRRQPCARRCMDASNATIVFCLGCASATDRRARCRHRRDRPGGRRRARLLSRRRQAVEHHSGVSELNAQVIVSEIGIDMSRFATPAHLRSWAGLCPRNDESAGKHRSTRLRRGAPWLKATLVQLSNLPR